MIVNKLLYRISLNKARSWIMVFNCNINAFSNLTSIIYLYNENMNLEMTIKKLGSAYKFRVGRATGNEHIFLFGLLLMPLKYQCITLVYTNLHKYRENGVCMFINLDQISLQPLNLHFRLITPPPPTPP